MIDSTRPSDLPLISVFDWLGLFATGTPDVIVSVSNKIEAGISKQVSNPKPAQGRQIMPGHFMKILR